jgi:hypothetical protein
MNRRNRLSYLRFGPIRAQRYGERHYAHRSGLPAMHFVGFTAFQHSQPMGVADVADVRYLPLS